MSNLPIRVIDSPAFLPPMIRITSSPLASVHVLVARFVLGRGSRIASNIVGSSSNSNLDANLIARNMLKGVLLNVSTAFRGVRIMPFRRSSSP